MQWFLRQLSRTTLSIALLLTSVVACGSDGLAGPQPEGEVTVLDQIAPETDTTTLQSETSTTAAQSTTTTEIRTTQIEADQLPYVACHGSAAALSVLDPASGESEITVEGLEHICNRNGQLIDSYDISSTSLTGSGRYLITKGFRNINGSTQDFVIASNIETGRSTTVTDASLDQWATAQTGTGLDSHERDLHIGGLDRTGDGRIFFYEGYSAEDNETVWFVQSSIDAGLSLQELPDNRPCYQSTRWSTDGSHCWFREDGGTSSPAYPTSTVLPENDNNFPSESFLISLTDGNDWISPTIAVGGTGGGIGSQALYIQEFGNDATEIYSIPGDRRMLAWVNSRSSRVFLASPTVDGNSTEVYSIDLTPGSTPELLTTITARIRPVAN